MKGSGILMDRPVTKYPTRVLNINTNNTFNEDLMNSTIKAAVETSFKYLRNLQRSYVNILRFNLTNDDIYSDINHKVCVSLDKDFIDAVKRKEYKNSEYYGNYVTLDEIAKNRDIFTWIPIVFINDEFNPFIKIKCSLDGTTEIQLSNLTYSAGFTKREHRISVTFLKDCDYTSFTTHKYAINAYHNLIPTSSTKSTLEPGIAFAALVSDDGNRATNFSNVTINEDLSISLDLENEDVSSLVQNSREVTVHVFRMNHFYPIAHVSNPKMRLDGKYSSLITVISPDDKDSNEVLNMPVPPQNLFILKYDTTTKEYTYINDAEIIHHYPNIYEVKAEEDENSQYFAWYFYYTPSLNLKYKNAFDYVHKYYMYKADTSYLSEAICKLLYEGLDNDALEEYFFDTFDYDEADFIYNHGDFFASEEYPYTLDYKLAKLKAFIQNDPSILTEYSKQVGPDYDSYFLDVRNIDLENRRRSDTAGEAEVDSDIVHFSEDHYVLMFKNDRMEPLDFRVFIDGILCTHTYVVETEDMGYIYIPVASVKEDSYIEVERFYQYTQFTPITFDSVGLDEKEIVYTEDENITPTLFDLFVTDKSFNRIDRTKFKIYCLVDEEYIDVSDYLDEDIDYVESPEDGKVYVNIDYLAYVNISDSRVPLRYLKLSKVKVILNDSSLIGEKLYFVVNKNPYLRHEQMATTGLPKVKLFNGKNPWKESSSYIRTFVNGRLVHITMDIYEEDPTHTYCIPRCYIQENDILTIDVSPYSYELAYYTEEIPESYMIDLSGILTKPADLAYYDIYLNGRRMTDRNIQMIGENKIYFYHVDSRKNLAIYRKDWDYDFFGLMSPVETPIDKLLNSNISDEDKRVIMDSIVYANHETKGDSTDTESDVDDYTSVDDYVYEFYRFYLDIIQPTGVCKPNELFVSKTAAETIYTSVYEEFSNKEDRLVIRPNVNYDAPVILMIGKEHNAYYETQVKKMAQYVGDTSLISAFGDGSIAGAVVELFSRLKVKFKFNDNGILTASKETDD
jgi:hypothetical protein